MRVCRTAGAIVLLLCQLVALCGTPVALAAARALDTGVETLVCNCIHEPGTPCPMHGGRSRSDAPDRPAGPQWRPCGSGSDAALIAVVQGVGIPAVVPLMTPAVHITTRAGLEDDPVAESTALPAVPPPRA